MTYKEIHMTIKAYNNRQKYELQKQASMHYKLADLIGASVSRLIDANSEFPDIFEVYSDIFDEEIQVEQRSKSEEQKQRLQAERLKAMILNHTDDYKRNMVDMEVSS